MAETKNENTFDVEEAYGRTESWVVENQKSLSIILGAIVVMVTGYFAYRNFIYMPQEEEAREQIWRAEKYFENDSLDAALYGNELAYGFLDIIDNYGSTKTGNLAYYYAGISFLRLGDFESAIAHLEEFDCTDVVVCAVALGATGDAYMELGDTEKAAEYYENAALHNNNELTAPVYMMKAGKAYESLGEHKKALSMYEKIRSDYPNTTEGMTIEKYIARAEAYVPAS